MTLRHQFNQLAWDTAESVRNRSRGPRWCVQTVIRHSRIDPRRRRNGPIPYGTTQRPTVRRRIDRSTQLQPPVTRVKRPAHSRKTASGVACESLPRLTRGSHRTPSVRDASPAVTIRGDVSRVVRVRGDAGRMVEIRGEASRVVRVRGDAGRMVEIRGEASRVVEIRGDAMIECRLDRHITRLAYSSTD